MKQSEDSLVEQQSSKAPWTIQQTFLGIILTLAPWIILVVSLSPGNSCSRYQGALTSVRPHQCHSDFFPFQPHRGSISHCPTVLCQSRTALYYSTCPAGMAVAWPEEIQRGTGAGLDSSILTAHLRGRHSLPVPHYSIALEPADERPGYPCAQQT